MKMSSETKFYLALGLTLWIGGAAVIWCTLHIYFLASSPAFRGVSLWAY